VEKDPNFSAGFLNLGHALEASGKTEEARQVWNKAMQADPELPAEYLQ
jgi:predicted negative regulator of RcsB-dependent stress response